MKKQGKTKDGEFEFREGDDCWVVYVRGKKIGELVTMREVNERYCFRLGMDNREYPRTYRGRVRAARALKIVADLIEQSKEERWSKEELILNAWDSKPATAPRN